jgi:hypothetical protein
MAALTPEDFCLGMMPHPVVEGDTLDFPTLNLANTATKMRTDFGRMGFGDHEIAALMGAHQLVIHHPIDPFFESSVYMFLFYFILFIYSALDIKIMFNTRRECLLVHDCVGENDRR